MADISRNRCRTGGRRTWAGKMKRGRLAARERAGRTRKRLPGLLKRSLHRGAAAGKAEVRRVETLRARRPAGMRIGMMSESVTPPAGLFFILGTFPSTHMKRSAPRRFTAESTFSPNLAPVVETIGVCPFGAHVVPLCASDRTPASSANHPSPLAAVPAPHDNE